MKEDDKKDEQEEDEDENEEEKKPKKKEKVPFTQDMISLQLQHVGRPIQCLQGNSKRYET